MLSIDNNSKARRIKNLFDLIVCELCSISVALILDCFIFFNYFKAKALPIVFISILAVVAIGSVVFRKYYINKLISTGEIPYFWYNLGKKIKAFGKKIKYDQWKG